MNDLFDFVKNFINYKSKVPFFCKRTLKKL